MSQAPLSQEHKVWENKKKLFQVIKKQAEVIQLIIEAEDL